MRGSQPDPVPGDIGRKVEPEPPAPAEETWAPLPGRPGYERSSKGAVRTVPEPMSIYEFFGVPRP